MPDHLAFAFAGREPHQLVPKHPSGLRTCAAQIWETFPPGVGQENVPGEDCRISAWLGGPLWEVGQGLVVWTPPGAVLSP